MTVRKTARLLTLTIAASLLLSACGQQIKKGEFFGKLTPPEGQVMRYVSGSEPESLDPQMSSGQNEARVAISMFEGLLEYHPKTLEPIPGIAERWASNSDASEYVFFLRRNAKFSNGDPVTARDFVYTLRRGLRPELASRVAFMAYDIKYAEALNEGEAFVRDPKTGRFVLLSESAGGEGGAAQPSVRTGVEGVPDTDFNRLMHEPERLTVPLDEKDRAKKIKPDSKLAQLIAGKELVPVEAKDIGVEAVDDYTLRFVLRSPTPYFLGLAQHQFFRAIPEKVVERYGVNWTKPENIVCSGAFKLAEHKPYNQIVVVKNPYYWDAQNVRLDKIVFYPLEEQTTMMNLYKAGELDATYNHTVPASWLKAGLRYAKDYMDAPENGTQYWQLNTTKGPTADKRVRKALAMSIDRKALENFRVVSKALGGFVPDGILPGYKGPPGFITPDVEGAKRLLAEAGYKDASGKYDPSKFPAKELEITYNTSESNRQVGEFIQAQWRQNLGITVALHSVETKTYFGMRARLDYKGIGAGAGWSGDYMDPYTYLGLFMTAGGDNGTGWYDPAYVKMVSEANHEADQAKRYAMLAKAEEYLLDNAPVIPLLKPATSWMKKPYVKGMYPNPGTLHAWKFVYIEHDPSKWDQGMPDMKTPGLAD